VLIAQYKQKQPRVVVAVRKTGQFPVDYLRSKCPRITKQPRERHEIAFSPRLRDCYRDLCFVRVLSHAISRSWRIHIESSLKDGELNAIWAQEINHLQPSFLLKSAKKFCERR